ncbi:MAG: 30S ribosomal protein S12 methylthiotransferase RimO [Erysipelotrichaceae bacterium]|nr:30S ribosomal protein S12 methylthiotransferase RimO [Erysipelotrichaceae bacterium]
MKVGLVSLGCAKNLVDSEAILALMKNNDFEIVSSPSEADVIIVNTCGFIESSKQESINTILEMASYNALLVVTGCLVQRYKEELEKELPEVDLFVPIRDYDKLGELISEKMKIKKMVGCFDFSSRVLSTPFYTAYLKISEGCNNRCTYCAIPLIRGSFVSYPLENLVNQAKDLASKGVKELVVISQDTTRYGSDFEGQNITTVTLLKELLKIKEFSYIRLLYLYPDELSDELIELMGKEERLTPYFDLPIQHSSSRLLQSMNRRGDREFLLSLIKKIRDKVPNAILRTTLIVGFPGETEEDIEDLKSFIQEVKFDHLGCFTYSLEEGTASATFENQIDEETKQQRYESIMEIQAQISLNNNKKRVGQTFKGIIIDYDEEHDDYLFRCAWNAPDDIDGNIYIKSEEPLEEGKEISVVIEDYDTYNLYGRIIEK